MPHVARPMILVSLLAPGPAFVLGVPPAVANDQRRDHLVSAPGTKGRARAHDISDGLLNRGVGIEARRVRPSGAPVVTPGKTLQSKTEP